LDSKRGIEEIILPLRPFQRTIYSNLFPYAHAPDSGLQGPGIKGRAQGYKHQRPGDQASRAGRRKAPHLIC
jgi:hypothetical protein